MQVKHWLVVCALVLAACEWKVPNPGFCAPGKQCPPVVIPCNSSGQCMDPVPVCKPQTMTCVECLSDGDCQADSRTDAEYCDSQKNKCVECTKHADCESDLCFDNQVCADPAEVLHVSATGADNPKCSKTEPCKLLKAALASVDLRKYIRVTGTITDTAETIIDGNVIGKSIHIYGDPGTSVLTSSADGPVLNIKRSANVTLVDVEIKGTAAASDGVELRDMPGPTVTMIRTKLSGHSGIGAKLTLGSLTLFRSQVLKNRTFGIDVSAGTLTLDGSWVYENSGDTAIRVSGATARATISSSVIVGNQGTNGGLDLGSPFTVTNTVIVGNGAGFGGNVGGAFLRAASGTFTFNTVANNLAGATGTSGIVCGGGSRTISNSILTGNRIDFATCTSVSYSLSLSTDLVLPTNMNNQVGDPKFMNMENPLEPTFYRIRSDSDARDKADSTTLVDVDIDGEERDDGKKDIGADEYTEPR
jgi:hypothetical protein